MIHYNKETRQPFANLNQDSNKEQGQSNQDERSFPRRKSETRTGFEYEPKLQTEVNYKVKYYPSKNTLAKTVGNTFQSIYSNIANSVKQFISIPANIYNFNYKQTYKDAYTGARTGLADNGLIMPSLPSFSLRMVSNENTPAAEKALKNISGENANFNVFLSEVGEHCKTELAQNLSNNEKKASSENVYWKRWVHHVKNLVRIQKLLKKPTSSFFQNIIEQTK